MNQTELIESIKENKQEIMLGLVIGLVLSILVLSCFAAYNYGIITCCERNGGLMALDTGICVYPMGQHFKTLGGNYELEPGLPR